MKIFKCYFFLLLIVTIPDGTGAVSILCNSKAQNIASVTKSEDIIKSESSSLKGDIRFLSKLADASKVQGVSEAQQPSVDGILEGASTQVIQQFTAAVEVRKKSIEIVGRQMLVHGRPFMMKGICYDPVRKGGTYPEDLITINPTPEDLAVIEKDFRMMRDAGINTVRSYLPILDARVLDLLTKYQLRTIVPVLNEARYLDKVSFIVSALKNHPSTLIWEIGNEWNYNFLYTKNSTNAQGIGLDGSVALLKQAALKIREIDTTHPISTCIGDLPTDTAFWSALNFKEIDLYGTNIYDGLTFGDRLTRWGSTNTKPLYISEFGATAYNINIGPIDPKTGNPTGAEDDNAQAVAIHSLVQEMLTNLSALNPNNVLVGGNLFEWNDEWWKPDNKSPSTHDLSELNQSNGIAGPYPDHLFHEEWFGILDIDRKPRSAYNELRKLYTSHE